MGRPRTLDYGQIRRFHKIGWNVPALAERFDVTCQAIEYALSKSADLKLAPASVDEESSGRQGDDNIRILLLDGLVLYRESLSRILAVEPGIQLADQCGSIAEALDIVSQSYVHIVLLHLPSRSGRGKVFLEQLQQQGYEGRVLVVTSEMSDLEAMELIRKGVGGLFLTHGSPEQLIQAIRKLAAGGSWLDAPFVEALICATATGARRKLPAEFTQRELQVLGGVVEGLGNKQIGERLRISESSVKATVQQLFRTTEVRTRSQLVRTALERKIALVE